MTGNKPMIISTYRSEWAGSNLLVAPPLDGLLLCSSSSFRLWIRVSHRALMELTEPHAATPTMMSRRTGRPLTSGRLPQPLLRTQEDSNRPRVAFRDEVAVWEFKLAVGASGYVAFKRWDESTCNGKSARISERAEHRCEFIDASLDSNVTSPPF